tara:strand:- start:1800 stop:2726 length:927 start_codon:yes stop_codon:yes gene_type:complete
MPKQNKNIIPNQIESNILDLERDYFKELKRIFNLPLFSTDMNKMAAWMNSNLGHMQQVYTKTNKVDIATQRLINYSVMKNLSNIIGVYASPISSDIAYETTNAIVLIDSKTNSEVGNANDFFDDFHYGPNQTSFDHHNYLKGTPLNFPGIPVDCNLPTVDSISNKPILTFFLITNYYQKKNVFHWSKTNPNIRLICVPNGKVSRFFGHNIISNVKDYKYEKNPKNKSALLKKNKNYKFSSNAIKFRTPQNIGYYEPSSNEIWLLVRRKKGDEYNKVVTPNERRTLIKTIEDRFDSNGNLWKGHSCWNI